MDGSNQRPSRPKARQSIAHIPSTLRSNGLDKQNATIDLSAARNKLESQVQLPPKRTRGKSLGPGGLEALKETDGNVTKTISNFQPRSILKPTVPLTPPKSIPSFEQLRRQSTTKKKSPAGNGVEALLIDFSTPGPSRDGVNGSASNSQSIQDPFSPIVPDDSASGNSSQTLQNGDDEERLRQERKKAILEQRAARRKSMANRRVSFAPEATLHTWSVMEMVEESTTSSASNSTRRQSSMTAQQTPHRAPPSPKVDPDPSEPPSTPPEQVEEPVVQASPAHQRDLHQKKRRRRSSAMSADVDFSGDEVYSSSPSGDVMTESSPIHAEDSIASESDTDGDTAMSMDEMTQNTIRSQSSTSSSQTSLEERLRQAANLAGTRGIEYDENGDDLSMEIANDTVTNAFQPWARNRAQQGDQESPDPPSPSPFKGASEPQSMVEEEDEDVTTGMTMEMTKAVGGILDNQTSPSKSRRKSALSSRRRSSMGRRQSTGMESSYGDESMDFTTVAGGILSATDREGEETDEEMTMEFTTAVGGVQYPQIRQTSPQSDMSNENDTMDMTAAVGGILDPIEERTEPQTDAEDERTMAMDMTRAVGQILARQPLEEIATPQLKRKSIGAVSASQVVNGEDLTHDDEQIRSTPRQRTSIASETGSPSLALKPRSSGRTRSGRASQSTTPKSSARSTPVRAASVVKHETPTKQLTPVPTRAETPERTPVLKSVHGRNVSPKKLFQAEIQAKASPASTKKAQNRQHNPLFDKDELTGRQTPRVVLQAPKSHQRQRRRSSGVGIDKEGIGSPSVTQLLARRSSIGDAAPEFKLDGQPASRLRFEDPKQMEQEIDAERAEEERRESGRFIMTQEADGQQEENATLQLKDMIESMTPKKKEYKPKTKGRKSLAVGSARGLLGKRPAELDDDDEADDDSESTPKRLKVVSREGSPVKKIHLPKPPSKEETTGRLTRAEQRALDSAGDRDHTPVLAQSPFKAQSVESPQQTTRFRSILADSSVERPTSLENKLDNVVGAVDPSIEHPQEGQAVAEEDKITLQQFLSMTNIHFIELNATKRRHTIMAQSLAKKDPNETGDASDSTEACFVAATTTMPLLELYQHATRELKSYISTGRKIVRSIEAETLAEQPPLFKEYIDARPDVKFVMDNQFRNGKTNARLQSKEGWYTWRSQLVEGLHGGLESIRNDMQADFTIVDEQASQLAEIVPVLQKRRDALVDGLASLRQRRADIESVDHEALKARRQDLKSADQELREKLEILETLRQQVQDKKDTLSQAVELKEEMQSQIAEANRVLDEHRGWASKDVLLLRAKASAISQQSGWSLVSAEEDPDEPNDFGVALTMSYLDNLRLFFYPGAYLEGGIGARRRSGRGSRSMSGPTAPISLTFSPRHDEDGGVVVPPLPTEKRFFLQLIQSQLHAFTVMPRGSVNAKVLLSTVSSGWDTACNIKEEIRLLNLAGITRVSIRGDEKLSVKLMLVLSDKSRIDIEFDVLAAMLANGEMSFSTSVYACGIYGPVVKFLDAPKTRKVQAVLYKAIENKSTGEGAWMGAVQAFEDWYRVQLQTKPSSERKTKKEQSKMAKSPAPVPVQTRSTTPTSPVPQTSKTPLVKRSPLAAKKANAIQKKTIPVPTRQEKFRTSQREREQQQQQTLEKTQSVTQEDLLTKGKENLDALVYGGDLSYKAPAITPEMQEEMMQRTPIKRVGALRRSPI